MHISHLHSCTFATAVTRLPNHSCVKRSASFHSTVLPGFHRHSGILRLQFDHPDANFIYLQILKKKKKTTIKQTNKKSLLSIAKTRPFNSKTPLSAHMVSNRHWQHCILAHFSKQLTDYFRACRRR